MGKLLIVMAGGAVGAAARYLVCLETAQRWGAAFPYGTLLVNVVGCFIIGVFMTLSTEFLSASKPMRLFLSVGFLGALTTFSSFALESLYLLQAGQNGAALLNIAANFIGGFSAAWMGIIVVRVVLAAI